MVHIGQDDNGAKAMRCMSTHPTPRSHRLFFSTKSNTSSSVATVAGGSSAKFRRTSARFPSVPHPSSPITDGCQNRRVKKHFLKQRFALPKVLHPDGSIDQNHLYRDGRGRGMGRIFASVPPRAAKSFAASRAINVSKPACTKAVFSVSPVSRLARSTSLSSSMSVVLICIRLHRRCA